MTVDLSDPVAVRAEAERRQRLRAAGSMRLGVDAPPVSAPPITTPAEAAGELAQRIPRRITLPWSCLIPDNRKTSVNVGQVHLSSEYRQAKKRGKAIAKEQVGELPPLTVPVRFEAVLYAPNTHRRRDLINLGKITQDILTEIVYDDDSQIDDARWRRGPIDIDRPRLEITVTPLP